MDDPQRARFNPDSNGADVGTATAFLLLPLLLVLVGAFIFVGTGWVFRGAGLERLTNRPPSPVTVDARQHAGLSREVGVKVALPAGDWVLSVKDGAYSPWGAETRPSEGWFWILQVDVGDRHYELGDPTGAADRPGALAAHLGQRLTVSVDRPTDAYLWITDPSPADNEGALVVQIDPAR